MRLKIANRSYWMQENGGYIWQEYLGRPATLGTQICKVTGTTIRATPENFNQTVRAYDNRQRHQRIIKAYGERS